MSLTSRKLIVLSLIGGVFLAGNILVIAQWLADRGVAETATFIQTHFLTGTALTVILALLILLVNPNRQTKANIHARTCPVCDARLSTEGPYCAACGSRV